MEKHKYMTPSKIKFYMFYVPYLFVGWILKKLLTGGPGGSEGTFPIFSLKWNYKYLLISQKYPHLYAFNWMIMGSWCVIIQLSKIHVGINHSSMTWRFRTLQSFDRAQFSAYYHWTTFIVKRKQVRIEAYLYTLIEWYFFYYKKVDVFLI